MIAKSANMAKLKNKDTLVQVNPCSKNSMSGNKRSETLKGLKMIKNIFYC
jgi:hypothetical protein